MVRYFGDPHLLGLFPSTRMAPEYAIWDGGVSHTLAGHRRAGLASLEIFATFSVHASLDQQQVLVTVLRGEDPGEPAQC